MIHGCIQQSGKWISEKVNPENPLIQVILIQTIGKRRQGTRLRHFDMNKNNLKSKITQSYV